MSLSPLAEEKIKLEALNKPFLFDFSKALLRTKVATKKFLEHLDFFRKNKIGQVINIFGANGSGRSTVALTLALLFQERNNFVISFTWSFEQAHKELEKEEILIVEQGEKLKEHKSLEDEYGLEQLRNASHINNSITIVITDQKVAGADFYLQTIDVEYENKANVCILAVANYQLGVIKLVRKSDKKLEETRKLAREDFLKSIVEFIFERIEETTEELKRRWLKRKEIIFAEKKEEIDPEDPAIIFIPVIILGGQGDGKSTLAKILVQLLIDYYGEEHVHALRHERELIDMIQHGFSNDEKKFIQVFVADDFTYTKFKLEDLQDFSKIRHYMARSGILQGVAIVIMNMHYLTGNASPVAIRNILEFLFVLNATEHDYTRNTVLSKFLTESEINFLDYIKKLKEQAELNGNAEQYLRLKGYGVCFTRGKSYPFYLNREKYQTAKIEMYQTSEKSSISELLPSDELLETENLEFYDTLVYYLTKLFAKKYNNKEYIIASWLYRTFCDRKFSNESIYKRLKDKLNFSMISSRGKEIRKGSLYKVTNDFDRKVTREVQVLNKKTGKIEYKEDWKTKISNTEIGRYLEYVIVTYLNTQLQKRGFQQTFSRFGGEGEPDLLLGTDPENKDQLAINVKFRDGDRTSHVVDSNPEREYKHCWLVLYQPKYGLLFKENKKRLEKVTIGKEEGKRIKEFLGSIENLLKSSGI